MTARAGRDRVFARALLISALVHLSAVTLFRIVIYFPRHDIEYYSVSIVESAPNRKLSVPEGTIGAVAQGIPFDTLDLGQTLALNDPLQSFDALPEIELPTLQFEELSLLRLRQEALEVRSRYDNRFARGGSLALSRLSTGIDTVSDTLNRLTFGGAVRTDDHPSPISRPAPGFEAYVEWLSEPKDREVFEVQPIPELRGRSADAVPEPITIPFRVDRDGRVIHVLSPIGGLLVIGQAAADALRGYRFEPLIGDGPDEQGGTFILRASGDMP